MPFCIIINVVQKLTWHDSDILHKPLGASDDSEKPLECQQQDQFVETLDDSLIASRLYDEEIVIRQRNRESASNDVITPSGIRFQSTPFKKCSKITSRNSSPRRKLYPNKTSLLDIPNDTALELSMIESTEENVPQNKENIGFSVKELNTVVQKQGN